MVSEYCVPLKSLISYTCIIHEHISCELNFDVQQLEPNYGTAQMQLHTCKVNTRVCE